jgi:hypothetical protein
MVGLVKGGQLQSLKLKFWINWSVQFVHVMNYGCSHGSGGTPMSP